MNKSTGNSGDQMWQESMTAQAELESSKLKLWTENPRTFDLGYEPNLTRWDQVDRQTLVDMHLRGEGRAALSDRWRRAGVTASWFSTSSSPSYAGFFQHDLCANALKSLDGRSFATLLPTPATKRETPMSTLTSRFNSMFVPKAQLHNSAISSLSSPVNPDDDLLTLDLSAALSPSSSSANAQDASSLSFKNMFTNAEALLLRLQTAYKIRTSALHDITTQHSLLTEELEEYITRAGSLRSQLEDLAHSNAMKDERIFELERELETERRAKKRIEKSLPQDTRRLELASELGLYTTELNIKNRPSWRSSVTSTDISSSSDGHACRHEFADIESDDDSGAGDSVFSCPRSPALTTRSSVASPIPEMSSFSPGSVTTSTPSKSAPTSHLPQQQVTQSRFHKLLASVSVLPAFQNSSRDKNDNLFWGGAGKQGCGNCQGQDSGVAWDTVSLLRAENKGLKDRVEVLEEGVESALQAALGRF